MALNCTECPESPVPVLCKVCEIRTSWEASQVQRQRASLYFLVYEKVGDGPQGSLGCTKVRAKTLLRSALCSGSGIEEKGKGGSG